MGAFECPAVGSSVFSSPLVELITWGETERQREQPGGLQPFPTPWGTGATRRSPSSAREHRGALGGRTVPLPRARCSASVLSSPQEPHCTQRSEPLRRPLEGSQLLGAPAPGEGLAGSHLQRGQETGPGKADSCKEPFPQLSIWTRLLLPGTKTQPSGHLRAQVSLSSCLLSRAAGSATVEEEDIQEDIQSHQGNWEVPEPPSYACCPQAKPGAPWGCTGQTLSKLLSPSEEPWPFPAPQRSCHPTASAQPAGPCQAAAPDTSTETPAHHPQSTGRRRSTAGGFAEQEWGGGRG